MGIAAAAAGTAVLVVFKKMVKQYVETGDMIHKMAIRTGFAAETLSELAYAADISGADITMLEKGVKKMSKTIVDASYGLETYLRVFRSLGLDIEDLMRLTPEEQFLKIGAAIADMESQTLKTAAAVDVFGRAGTMLLPLFAEGAEGIAKLSEEAHTLGIIFDDEAAAKAAKLKDAQTALTGSVKGLSIAILNDLIPIITGVVKQFTDWFVETRSGAKNWAKAIVGFFKVIAMGLEGMMLAFHAFKIAIFKIGEEIAKMALELLEAAEATVISSRNFALMSKLLPPLGDAIHAMTVIQDAYKDSADDSTEKMTDLVFAFDKFFTMLDKVSGGLKKSKKVVESILPPAREMADIFKAMVGVVEPAVRDMTGVLEKAVTKMTSHVYEGTEEIETTWEDTFWKIISAATLFTSSLSGLFNQITENQMANIDKEYEARKAAIENSMMTEKSKADAMERLDAATEKKRKKAQRSAAKRTKAVSLMEAIVNTAAAVVQAMKAPFPLSLILPIIIGAMGAAQIALIAATPLPSFQRGGRIEEAGIVGEAGPELFVPGRPGEIIPIRERARALGAQVALTFNPTFYLSTLDPQTARDVVREQIGPELLEMFKTKIMLPEFQDALRIK